MSTSRVDITIDNIRYIKNLSPYYVYESGMYSSKLSVCLQVITPTTKMLMIKKTKERRYYMTTRQHPYPWEWKRIV